jgi:DNA-binding transcriptional LysR family regulator
MKLPQQFYYKRNRLQQIKGFCYTAQTGSMSKSAKIMGLSQSTVTLQIQSLERDLGFKLFKRDKKKIDLTKEGKMFYSYSIPYVQGIDGLFENFISNLKQDKLKTINIAANTVSICYILPKYIRKFEIKNPEVKFEIKNLVKEDALKRLLSDEVDMLIYSMQPDETPDNLEFIPIAEYEPVLLTRKNHPLAKKSNIKLSDIKNYSLLRLDKKFVTVPNFDDIAKHHGLKTKIEFEMANYEILKKFVKADIGIAIISNICLEGEEEKSLTGTILTEFFPKITYGILVKKGKMHCGLLKKFIEILKTERLLSCHKGA